MNPASPVAILADVVACSLIVVGAAGLASPRMLSTGFGLPLQDRNGIGFVWATCVRDVAYGAAMLAASLRGASSVLLIIAIGALAISLADFCNAFFAAGRALKRAHVAHGGGAALFAAIVGLLIPIVRP